MRSLRNNCCWYWRLLLYLLRYRSERRYRHYRDYRSNRNDWLNRNLRRLLNYWRRFLSYRGDRSDRIFSFDKKIVSFKSIFDIVFSKNKSNLKKRENKLT